MAHATNRSVEARSVRILVRCAVTLATLVGASRAAASTSFPPAMAKYLSLDCTPPCVTCHTSETGGSNNLTELGDNLRRYGGLVQGAASRIPRALQCIEAPGPDTCVADPNVTIFDSDGDGVGDIAELRRGTFPERPDDELLCDIPEYGCTVSERHGPTEPAHVALPGLALALALLARRSRSRQKP